MRAPRSTIDVSRITSCRSPDCDHLSGAAAVHSGHGEASTHRYSWVLPLERLSHPHFGSSEVAGGETAWLLDVHRWLAVWSRTGAIELARLGFEATSGGRATTSEEPHSGASLHAWLRFDVVQSTSH